MWVQRGGESILKGVDISGGTGFTLRVAIVCWLQKRAHMQHRRHYVYYKIVKYSDSYILQHT
jgi:hypothetical protein